MNQMNEPPGEPAVNVLFLVMCFVSFLGRRQKLAITIPTVVERLQSGKKTTVRVEAMGKFSSVASRWSSLGGRGW